MPYTRRQCERIRESIKEYYDRQHIGPRKITWDGLCDEIIDVTGREVRPEFLRQWVRQFVQKGRNEPIKPNDDELGTLVEFLMSPNVDMLTLEELEDPEPPRFLRSFLEFLHNDQFMRYPQAMNGVYEAWHRAETDEDEEKWIKTNIELDVYKDEKIIRVADTLEYHFREDGKTEVIGGTPGEGWGVLTPEGNMLLFMKSKHYVRNYYYLTIAVDPHPSNEFTVRQLALMRHEGPASCDPSAKSLEELIRETNGRTSVLNFNKVAALQ